MRSRRSTRNVRPFSAWARARTPSRSARSPALGATRQRKSRAVSGMQGMANCMRSLNGKHGSWMPPGVRASLAAAGRRECGGGNPPQAGKHFISFLSDVRSTLGLASVCLGGGFFYNTYINSLVSQSGLFARALVAQHSYPGLAAGAACCPAGDQGSGKRCSRTSVPIRLSTRNQEHPRQLQALVRILSESEVLERVVDALVKGHLVGWFQGRMEWGHRALGNRSIVASPLSPFVLDNLNTYSNIAISMGLRTISARGGCGSLFAGPSRSRWMEYDYQIRDEQAFVNVLPGQRGPSACKPFQRPRGSFTTCTGPSRQGPEFRR